MVELLWWPRRELATRVFLSNCDYWSVEQLLEYHGRSAGQTSQAQQATREEAIPELEIDVDELLDMPSDGDRATRVKDLLVDCYKPTDDFVAELLDKIRGMQKLSTPQKK
ncbi:protein phosphatase 1, regulatory (inhibitor) subunit 14Bb isoform X2 [Scleropages formosus]|uniref:protein phosphatase 1, regulatory (inhibitor) subunit 14Bb isoform X2 n=1 Tax=Scleropages formosus TaxID=113540 RepID=UPI000878D7DB|nr:protein phosphatase 1 regulatory subunit 14B isoform X2 [Scleropages formosus]